VARIDEIVAGETFHDAAFRHRYLTEHIRFTLGAREKAGMEKFRELLVKHGLVPPADQPLIFI
jgi:chorismate dehydratase